MNKLRKFVVLGPVDTLRRMGPQLLEDLKPKYVYQYASQENDFYIVTTVFEEYQRLINSSTSLTCVIEYSNKSIKFELMPTGGRMGFRGSASDSQRPLVDAVVDFIFDFAKRYGLTPQELAVAQPEEK
ncbi:hypothetical protein EP331_15135 [bacterium]|nr:MAG: hypothetical protein EP331_15135 [bacterium]